MTLPPADDSPLWYSVEDLEDYGFLLVAYPGLAGIASAGFRLVSADLGCFEHPSGLLFSVESLTSGQTWQHHVGSFGRAEGHGYRPRPVAARDGPRKVARGVTAPRA